MNNPFNDLDVRLKEIEYLLKEISSINVDPLKGQNDLLSKQQVSKLLGISLSTLWRWTRDGKLNAYGIENRVYYKKEDIITALKKIN